MRLQVVKNMVQPDQLNSSQGSDGELVHWKRVKTEGLVIQESQRSGFEVYLDLRSRIMLVRVPEDSLVRAADVADGLVNAMCTYIPVPKSRLFVQRAAMDSRRVEWMVTDAEQVSGLLHRLKEAKEFDAPEHAPYPTPLVPLLEQLTDAVITNLRWIAQWQLDRQHRGRMSHHIRYDRHAWDVLHARFVEATDDAAMLSKFARFFDLVGLMNPHVTLYLNEVDPLTQHDQLHDRRWDASRRVLYHLQEEATRLGRDIVDSYGTPAQRKADLGPPQK